ncbi:MAG: zf-HC2 domain-containing protein [Alphaproteobacteria bacterium]
MGELSDEMIMAYADGELAPKDRAAVEAQLATDAEARERLRVFEATRGPVAELYDETLQEPVPGHLLKLVLCDEPPRYYANTSSSGAAKQEKVRHNPIVTVLNAVGKTFISGPRLSMATAWSVLILAVAGGAGLYLNQTSGDSQQLVAVGNGQIFASGPLLRALETVPSGKKVSLGESPASALTVRVVLTFKNRHQAFCRQYNAMTSKGGYAGVACRTDAGQWRLDIHMASAGRPAMAEPSKHISPASKAATSVETAVRKIIEGDALGPAEEQTLINNNWQP